MFREIILPIVRSTILCVTACGIMHPRCCRPQAVTHSLVLLKMGKIIARNMSSWLKLLISRYCCVWLVYVIYIFHYIFLRLAKQSQFIPLQNVVYFISLPFLVLNIFTFCINDVLLFKCPFPGPKGQRDMAPMTWNSVYLAHMACQMPTCIETERAWTHFLLYSLLFSLLELCKA